MPSSSTHARSVSGGTKSSRQTLILTAVEIERLLDLGSCIAAVEDAFLGHAAGRSIPPGVLGAHVPGGGFHVKAAGLAAPRARFAAKLNANFPGNGVRYGLPTIQGVVVLSDAECGFPLAVMDSATITVLRTAAATALAARHLARADASVATVCGCGAQSAAQLRALAFVRPLRAIHVHDLDAARARSFAERMARELGISVAMAPDLAAATRASDMIVTCTPSRRYFLSLDMVRPGTFIAAVGADSEEKQEIDPALMAASKVVADIRSQCAAIGDLHHAIAAGAMVEADVHAELADVLAGAKAGRETDDETAIFDSTGTALQDVAAAIAVHDRATATGTGIPVSFGIAATGD